MLHPCYFHTVPKWKANCLGGEDFTPWTAPLIFRLKPLECSGTISLVFHLSPGKPARMPLYPGGIACPSISHALSGLSRNVKTSWLNSSHLSI